MIRKNIMLATYRQLGRQMDERLLPSESILHYLQISPEYLGASVNPERFKKFNANGQPIQEAVMEGDKIVAMKTVWHQDRPLCFNYKLLSEKFGIILDSYTGEVPQEPDEEPKGSAQEEMLPFQGGEGADDAPF